MNKNQVIAIFECANVEVLHIWELPNGYSRRYENPWWLIKTYKGLIEVGFRRRVFNLDWSDTNIRKMVFEPHIYRTQTDHYCHVHDYNEIIEALQIIFDTVPTCT